MAAVTLLPILETQVPVSPTASEGDDIFSRVRVLLPHGQDVTALLKSGGSAPFSEQVLTFVDLLGRRLRSDPAVRPFPELVALGFWARRSNLQRLQDRFAAAYPDAIRLPRGVAFHVAPANVDTIFVYSLVLSMLAGNANLVRISSRGGDQHGLLLGAINAALEEADPALRRSLAIVQYERDQAITDAISARVDLRVIWGGDETVRQVRQSPLAVNATELVFPNRFSMAVFDAAAWLSAPDSAQLARRFVNDTFWFGQMACSSPRAVVWRGDEAAVKDASASFWPAVEAAVAGADLAWEDAFAVEKLIGEQRTALKGEAEILPTSTNRVRVVRRSGTGSLGSPVPAGNGFFEEYRIQGLEDLAAIAADDWQTIVSHGISAEEWRAAIGGGLRGVHRIVKIGDALNFSAVWDGVDLLAAMTRLTSLSV